MKALLGDSFSAACGLCVAPGKPVCSDEKKMKKKKVWRSIWLMYSGTPLPAKPILRRWQETKPPHTNNPIHLTSSFFLHAPPS
jgi:hypothetical protein